MPLPTSPPTLPLDPSESDLLLTFLHERDHACPRCGYNLRNLTQPVCPECQESLFLKVGLQKLTLHWLLLALAPGTFCAIGLGFFFGMSLFRGFPPMPLEGVLTLVFLAISGTVGIWLALRNRWFLRQPTSTQITWAATLWAIHLTAFLYVAYFA
jgi:hypothetical protein